MFKKCLKNRRTSCQAIQKLDLAWQECSKPLPSLNRKPLWPNIENRKVRQSLKNTELQIQKIEKIQQETFFMFQGLCAEKNETHLQEGKRILQELEAPQTPAEYQHSLHDSTLFFLKEAEINRSHLKIIQKLHTKAQSLLNQLNNLEDHFKENTNKKILREKVKTLRKFLLATLGLLSPITTTPANPPNRPTTKISKGNPNPPKRNPHT
jgi:hypothetical protein